MDAQALLTSAQVAVRPATSSSAANTSGARVHEDVPLAVLIFATCRDISSYLEFHRPPEGTVITVQTDARSVGDVRGVIA